MNEVIAARREALRMRLSQEGLDTLMVSVAANRRYLSGFTGEDGQFDETAGILLHHECERGEVVLPEGALGDVELLREFSEDRHPDRFLPAHAAHLPPP